MNAYARTVLESRRRELRIILDQLETHIGDLSAELEGLGARREERMHEIAALDQALVQAPDFAIDRESLGPNSGPHRHTTSPHGAHTHSICLDAAFGPIGYYPIAADTNAPMSFPVQGEEIEAP